MSNKRSQFVFLNWKLIFLTILCTLSVIISISTIIYLGNQIYQIKEFENYIEQHTLLTNEENQEILKSNLYIEFCEAIDNKADNAFNQLITIVGIFVSIITLLGVLITFKAPKDIEKDILTLRELTDKTNKLIEEQEYLLLIFNAVTEKTIYHRIKALTKIINDHPTRWKAYLYRGNEYESKKDYDNAISDFKKAKKLGCKEETYLNNISIAISNRFKKSQNRIDRDLALRYITKAISINPEDPVYYINRGIMYIELKSYKKAEKDFDMALSIDHENYEAYSGKASLYMEMAEEASQEKSEEYKEKAIEFVNKALDLNSEDSLNLKRLNMLLREKFINDNKENQMHNESIVEDLSFKIDERLGDLYYEDEQYVDSITHYTDALTRYNTLSNEIIRDNIITISRICAKIRKCKQKMPSINVCESINSKLESLIIMLGQIGFKYYQEYDFEMAGSFFEYSTTLSGFGTSYSNNLAYMMRREEYASSNYKINELLACKTPDDSSAFLRINRALCMITGIGYEYNIKNALKEIHICENELNDALSWWCNESIVGRAESNVVILLLRLMKKIDLEECDINSMISQAIIDGYDLPENIVEISKEILNNSQ